MEQTVGFHHLPEGLPEPVDDGAAAHLLGLTMRSVPLRSTDGRMIDIASLEGITVAYLYPMTGQPGIPLPEGWDTIPGARGCTPQACAFRDHFANLQSVGARHLFGISSQSAADQMEAVDRLHLPFPLLSDQDLMLARTLNILTFQCDGRQMLRRLTLIVLDGLIVRVFYPVFPPDGNARDVLAALRAGIGPPR